MKISRYNLIMPGNGWAMFAGILYIWMSTIGVLNHDDTFLYKHGQTVISHSASVASTDDDCIACQWMVGSLSSPATYAVELAPVLVPGCDLFPTAETFHTHDFHHIPPRGPPAIS